MVDELKQAREAIQSMWTGICNIFRFKDTEDKYGVTNLPEVYVPPGSVIEVTQNGITRKYKHSGISAVYTNHQEIVLEAYKGSA